jgi:L-lactate dehydrogenase complex protein LldF
MNTPQAMLHPELLAQDDANSIIRDGRRLDHAEAASKRLRSRPELQPRGAKVHGNRPIDQAEAAARFIAAAEHEKMHDERLWDLRQKRDREMHGIAEWEELRSLASAIKEHTLTHLDEYLEQFEIVRARTAFTCIGRATPPSTTASFTASSATTAPSR